MDAASTYAELKKPPFSPPAWVFGPVWIVLYVIIAISFGTVFYRAYIGDVPSNVAALFALNLLFNFSFTYFQFRLKNNYLAALDILLCLVTLKLALGAIYPYIPWVTYVNIPYFGWVGFATVLQLTITYLNRMKARNLR